MAAIRNLFGGGASTQATPAPVITPPAPSQSPINAAMRDQNRALAGTQGQILTGPLGLKGRARTSQKKSFLGE